MSTPSRGRKGVGSSRRTRPGRPGRGAFGADLLERPDDGEKRTLDRRKAIDPLVRIDGQAETAERINRLPALGAPVDERTPLGGQVREAKIFEDGQRRGEA